MTMHIKAPIMIHGNGVRWSQCAKCGKAFGLSDGFCEGSHLCCGDCGQNLLLAKMSNLEWEALCEQYPATSPAMTTIKPSIKRQWDCSGISHVEPGPGVVGYVSERDSSEADAAQAMFVEHGFSAEWVIAECNPAGWGLVNYAAYEAWSQKQAAERLRNFRLTPRPLKFPIKPTVMVMDFDRPSVGGGKTALMFGTAVHAELAKYCKADIDAARDGLKYVEQAMIRRKIAKAAFNLGEVAKTYLTREERNAAKKGIKGNLAADLRHHGLPWVEVENLISELVEAIKPC